MLFWWNLIGKNEHNLLKTPCMLLRKRRQFILLKYKYGPDFNFFSELVYYLKNYYYKYGKGVLSLLVLQCEGGRAKRAADAEKGNF